MKKVSDCCGYPVLFSHNEQVYMGNCLVDLKAVYICTKCNKPYTPIEEKEATDDKIE